MSEENRATLTIGLWFLSTAALVALFVSAAAQGELTSAHTLLAFVILGLAVAGTPMLLRWKDSDTQQEKVKRQHVDSLLRDLSDEELIELRRRLANVDDGDKTILDDLGDDGELVLRH